LLPFAAANSSLIGNDRLCERYIKRGKTCEDKQKEDKRALKNITNNRCFIIDSFAAITEASILLEESLDSMGTDLLQAMELGCLMTFDGLRGSIGSIKSMNFIDFAETYALTLWFK